MALQTHFLEIYIAILCINGGIYMVDSLSGQNLLSPFDTSTPITPVDQPNIFNSTNNTNTLTGNSTTTGVFNNSTIGGSSSTLNPVDSILYPITLLWTFVQFITGGFIWTMLGIFGLPAALVYSLQGVIGLLLAITIVYYLTGR